MLLLFSKSGSLSTKDRISTDSIKNRKKWISEYTSAFVLFTFCCYFRLKIKGQRLLIWWRFHPFLASVRQSLSFITSFLSVFLPCLTLFSFLPSCVCPMVFEVTKQKFFELQQHHCKAFHSMYLALLMYCCFLTESVRKRHRIKVLKTFVR